MPAKRFVMDTAKYSNRRRLGHHTDCRQCGAECFPGTAVVSKNSRPGIRKYIYCEECAVRLRIIRRPQKSAP